MKKIIFYLLPLLVLVVIIIWFFKKEEDKVVVDKQEKIHIQASELYAAYEKNEEKANELYQERKAVVTGEIGEVLNNAKGEAVLILKGEDDFFGVKCTLSDPGKTKRKYQEGQIVTVEGVVSGGGGGMDVELTECKVLKSK